MTKKEDFEKGGVTLQINLSGANNEWNGACLNFAEITPNRFDAIHNDASESPGGYGYAANVSRHNLQWNSSCLSSAEQFDE